MAQLALKVTAGHPGDITVCIFADIMAYEAGDTLRELTPEEQIPLRGLRILAVQRARAYALLMDKLMSPKGSTH